jgi:hypothetical protein
MLWILRTLWTFPTTAVGLFIGLVCTPFGARWQVRKGTLECHSGLAAWLLEHGTVLEGGALAITFGDVILGRTPAALDLVRTHEQVHVRQAHRWGPFFIPAYLLASLVVKLRGGDAYRGNPFEVEAYGITKGPK